MSRDRSLEEFVGGSDAGSESAGSRDDPGDESGGVEPIESTYCWSLDGAACDSCGTIAESRWRDDGALVCADCKEW